LRKHYANLFFLSGEGEAGLFAIATREYFLLFCHPDLNHAQIESRKSLSLEENIILTTYIRSKSSLIRDLAEARLA
jgi:hypothetical protein